MATQTSLQSSLGRPAQNEHFLAAFMMSPLHTASRSERLERRQRGALAMHHYTDEELREILEMMWKEQDQEGVLSSDPVFVRKYIPSGLVPPEDEARLLRDRVDTNLIRRLNVQKGARDFSRQNSGGDPCVPLMHFTWYGVKPVLPPLLDGLPIIKLQELALDPRDINLEVSHPIAIRPGEILYQVRGPFTPEDHPHFGTLGFILTAEAEPDRRHVVATVGHVIGGFGRKAFMKTLTDEGCIFLNTVAGCERHLGRPAFRRKWPLARPALDEICLLEIPQASDQFVLSCLINDLDCHKISYISPDTISDSESRGIPTLTDVSSFQSWLRISGPLRVFKNGAKTGETAGWLVELEEVMDGLGQLPIHFLRRSMSFSDTSSSSTEIDQDDTRVYTLKVKWLSPEMPFAEPGDSGSLVFTRVGNRVVPLGIHVGSIGDVSRAYMLHSWWQEMDKLEDTDFYFCNSLQCSPFTQGQ